MIAAAFVAWSGKVTPPFGTLRLFAPARVVDMGINDRIIAAVNRIASNVFLVFFISFLLTLLFILIFCKINAVVKVT